MATTQHEVSEEDHKADLKIKIMAWVVIVALIALALLTYGKFADAPTIGSLRTTIKRSDCARKINNEQEIVKDAKVSASDDLQILNARGLAAFSNGDDILLAAVVKKYEKAINHLEHTKKLVDELKPTQVVVDRRCANL